MSTSASETPVAHMTLTSNAGFEVTVLDVGAALRSVSVPTPNGLVNCVLGYERLEDYIADQNYVGVTVGRYANRIRAGHFEIGGATYQVDKNEVPSGNCLHGGADGLHRQRFLLEQSNDSIICRHESANGSQGFPGNLKIEVIYQLLGDYSLSVEFRVTTDRDTVVNLATHAYFNLGASQECIDNHEIRVAADCYTPVDERRIPTGEIASVEGTKFDLRKLSPLGSRRLDHNLVTNGQPGVLRPCVELRSTETGISLLVHSTQAGVQIYTGDGLSDSFSPRQGVAIETQNFPDAPNQPNFPSASLASGASYSQQTIYEFSTPVS